MEGNLEVFGLFRAFSELYGPIWWSSAAALHVWRRGTAISGRLGSFWAPGHAVAPRRCILGAAALHYGAAALPTGAADTRDGVNLRALIFKMAYLLRYLSKSCI